MGTHTVDKKITLNSMEYPGFNRTVFVETHEVPVEIYFSEKRGNSQACRTTSLL